MHFLNLAIQHGDIYLPKCQKQKLTHVDIRILKNGLYDLRHPYCSVLSVNVQTLSSLV